MPSADPADQQAARSIEQLLRDAVEQLERPLVELEWFMALPKRIRRSGRLVKAAQAEAQVLLDHVRDNWAKFRKAEAAQETRLAELRAQPRDLECLRAPDGVAWQGVGRRKRRCRKFEAIGRAFNAREGITGAPVLPQPPPSVIYDVHALRSSQPRLLERPDTPQGLRQAVWSDPQLRQAASRPIRAGCTSPCQLSSDSLNEICVLEPAHLELPGRPSTPEGLRETLWSDQQLRIAALPTHVQGGGLANRLSSGPPTPEYPHSPPPEVFNFLGTKVSRNVAWIVACGHRALTKRLDYTIQDAVAETAQLEELEPGLLAALSDLLFPHGVSRRDLAVHPSGLEALLYFCLGWFHVGGRLT